MIKGRDILVYLSIKYRNVWDDVYKAIKEKELVDEFLSDQIVYKILNEETDLKILKVAESKIKYLKTHNG